MGMRRVKSWSRLEDPSTYDYSKVSDDDLLAMKGIARDYAAMFLTDGRGVFVEVLNRTGLYAINKELWKRGLTPAQEGKA